MKKIKEHWKMFSMPAKIATLWLIFICSMALLASIITRYPCYIPSGSSLEPPSFTHIIGTDDLGIDLWAQICYGARTSLMIGFGTALLAGVGGSLFGIFAAYKGGWVDTLMMRIVDMMIILPQLPLMIVLGAFLGPNIGNIVVVLALFSWTGIARIVRSKVLSLKQEKYVLAAQSYGASFFYIVKKHFFPSVFPLIMVGMIRLTSRAIVAEASLSFLGLGDPASKSWGMILHHALNFKGIYFTPYWKWWITSPLLAVLSVVIAIAFIGREIEKIINTKK